MNAMRMLTVLMAALILSVPAVCAQEEMSPEAEKVQAEIENKLGMTQEQKDKMTTLRKDFKVKQQAIQEQLKVKKDALRVELDGDNPDRKKAEALVVDVNKLQGQMMSNRVDMVFDMRGLLSAEQYGQLKQMREEIMQKRRSRRQGNGDIEQGNSGKQDKSEEKREKTGWF